MDKQDKQLYANFLSERLIDMTTVNEVANNIFIKELKPQMNNLDSGTNAYWAWFNRLSDYKKKIFLNDGKIYKKSDFKRVRIELNKVLIEAEKEKG